MKSYSIEVFEELKKLEPINPETRDFLINILEYESNGGVQWKKEYITILENIVNPQAK